jgi:uncharacterized protein YbcI
MTGPVLWRQDAVMAIATRSAASTAPAGGELNAALARQIVQVHRRYVGRGPSRARAFYRDNVVVVILSDVMTRAEQTLAACGRRDAVLAGRDNIVSAIRPQLEQTIESLTGCHVEDVLSDMSPETDMASLVVVLDRPVPSGDPLEGAHSAELIDGS